jgi:hypothetical protein
MSAGAGVRRHVSRRYFIAGPAEIGRLPAKLRLPSVTKAATRYRAQSENLPLRPMVG